jgi:hypothetical protein
MQRLSKSWSTIEDFGVKLTLDHILTTSVVDYKSGVWRGSDPAIISPSGLQSVLMKSDKIMKTIMSGSKNIIEGGE